MDDQTPVYARTFEQPIEAALDTGGPFGLGGASGVRLRRGDAELATVELANETGIGRRELGRIDFGGRRFTLTPPPDRTLGEWLAECFSRYRRRRVWRAGAGIAAEIRDITEDWRSALRGSFERDGTRYVVERDVDTRWFGPWEGDGRIKANGREVARIEHSLEDRRVWLITPAVALRLDVLAIALDLFMSLSLPRGGGGGGAGGGGGDGGGGC